jgi:hypothetical protein
MTAPIKLNPVRVYDKINDKLLRIEFFDKDSNFVIQAEWDEREEHTPRNLTNFQAWAYKLMEDKGYEIATLESV